MKIERDFYTRDAITVARDLLGKYIVREIDNIKIICKITETEAYYGKEDKASHAYGGKITERTKTMYEVGGTVYVYMIYGMYYCLNIVTGNYGSPEAVLIRKIEPVEGIQFIKERRNIKSKKEKELTNGPGKLCLALDIDKKLNGHDLMEFKKLYIIEGEKIGEIFEGKRINIDYAKEYAEKLWRFYTKGV